MSVPSPAASAVQYDTEVSNDYSGAGLSNDLLEPLHFVQMHSPRQMVAVRPMQQMLNVSIMPTVGEVVDDMLGHEALLFNDSVLDDLQQVLDLEGMAGMELGLVLLFI